jgi:DNA-binding CsgD family transcriptional regulator
MQRTRIIELQLLLKPQPLHVEVRYNQSEVMLLDVRWPELKERELLLLEELAKGKPMKAVAKDLSVSRRTAYRLLQGLKEKLGVDTSMELVAQAVRLGLIE